MTPKTKDGSSVRVTIGAKKPKRIADPTGALSFPSSGLSEASQEAMSRYKQKVKSGDIQISYP